MKLVYRIVIADDEVLIAMDLAEMLRELGHKVVGIARDGREALLLGEKEKPDIFILDVKMPHVDGIMAAHKIHQEKLGAIILLTAYNDAQTISRATNVGIQAYLLKPIKKELLPPTLSVAYNSFCEEKKILSRLDKIKQEFAERKVVEKAKGLLMEKYEVSEATAFKEIRDLSMKKGKTLGQISRIVIQKIEKEE